ncbi:MAG TPA: NADH:flavin oxidoreductase [Clostridiales bacterium]|nr:NADH:flavin oxidoreductase [Clostridiales bacterium]
MSTHERFQIKDLDDLRNKLEETGVDLPLSQDLSVLLKPWSIGSKTVPNRMAIHPMEGCDGEDDGSPSALVYRRYERFAKGGAGLLWVEATAVTQDGRANPRQLCINKQTLDQFKNLAVHIYKNSLPVTCAEVSNSPLKPYTVIQLTHSGRYSRPAGKPAPVIAARNPYLDVEGLEYHIITDDELEQLEDQFTDAAVLAKEAGFDAVDIKACHRYLNSELLSAFTREGNYGGSFENRTRFLLNIVDKIKAKLGDTIDIAVRLNAYDAIPYPYGWGVSREDHHIPDLTEPKKLIKILWEKGVKIVNVTCGNPYYNPHINRPYDIGFYKPMEHPLAGVKRILQTGKELQEAAPEMTVIGTGFSWLREFGAFAAAGAINDGWFSLAGFGRQSFAYPDFPRDIYKQGSMIRSKCCIACGKCSEIMRYGGKTGCVIKDSAVYLPLYNECRQGKPVLVSNHLAEHV